ncbi:MAG: prepilin-type N-terminal cleavage/methylation domain-containing protein [Candidatus Falkowbacteria bacterium]
MKDNKKGFTLVELLVVIAIIGLLSTLAVVALNNARQKARDARRVSDVKQIQTALELYYNDEGGYPATVATAITGPTSGVTYMALVPGNPQPGDTTLAGCGGDVYTYAQTGTPLGSSYALQYCLGATTGGISGNILHYATPAGVANP